MKAFKPALIILLFAVVQNCRSHLAQGQKFKCDVPDEWLLGNNVMGKENTSNFWPGAKWPGGVVKYELHGSLNDNDRNEVFRAIDDIQVKTCIRFEPRNGDPSYVSIEVDDNVCGLGHLCRTGGYQFAQFGGGCRNWNTMVHELGHNLCLGHEMSRKDRDEFTHFDGCPGNEIPGIDWDSDLRGSLYDFSSQMHYQCGWCAGGWPREGMPLLCGSDVQRGLSVMDADKLNEFYECGGCNWHRWRPINGLNDQHRREMVQFGQQDNGTPFYACRGLIGGEVSIGKFNADWGVCYLPFNGGEHQFGDRAQVFTWPGGVTSEGKIYKRVPIQEYLAKKGTIEEQGAPIPSGRTWDAKPCYMAVARIDLDGHWDVSIGKVCDEDWGNARFPFFGREVVLNQYDIIICS